MNIILSSISLFFWFNTTLVLSHNKILIFHIDALINRRYYYYIIMLKFDEQEILSVSQFVCRGKLLELPIGSINGSCIVCGRKSLGISIDLPKTFTFWEYFQEGDNICVSCKELLTNPDYRRSSWIATKDSFMKLDRVGVRKTLLSLPEPPFALYITKNYRKHGWLLTEINLSNKKFVMTIDDERYHVTFDQIYELTQKIIDCTKIVGRWNWLQDSISVSILGNFALEHPELYRWFTTNRFVPLVRQLVYFMVPTKKELKEIESQ